MASVEVSKLSQQEIAQLACTYASLILHDDGQDITADKIKALVQAAGIKVQGYWFKIFAKAISGTNISNFFNFGGATTNSAQQQPQEAPAKPEAKKEVKKAQPKEQPKEEEEDGGMGGLFD